MKKIIDRKTEAKKPIALKEAEVVIQAPEYEEQKQQVMSRIQTIIDSQCYSALEFFLEKMASVLNECILTPEDYIRLLVFEAQYKSNLFKGQYAQPAGLSDKTTSFMVEKMAQEIVAILLANESEDDLPFESKKRKFSTIATFEEFTSRNAKRELTKPKL